MTEVIQNIEVDQAAALLTYYGFEMRGYTATELLSYWLQHYQAIWVRYAVVEALYQGRYKAVSVEQILNFWFRRGNPNFHFNYEFERLICRQLPRYSVVLPDEVLLALQAQSPPLAPTPEEYSPSIFLPLESEEAIASPIISESESESILVQIPATESETEVSQLTPEVAIFTEILVDLSPQNLSKQIPNDSLSDVLHPQIHQFIPESDASEFYLKLKNIVNRE
jgi:hypothetical protein